MTQFDPARAMAAARHEFGEHGGVNMSIEASTTFTVMHAQTMPEIFHGQRGPDHGGCYLYGRHFNPTVYALGHQLAAMEGAEAGYCTASGMGAIAATLTQLCDHGERIVASDTLYGGTFALLHDYLPRKAGVRTTFVDSGDLAAVESALQDGARVLYAETLANPTLKLADLPALASLAHSFGAQLVVDNTFSPMMVSPIRHGADVVVHSLTKFVSGASDIIAGAIVGRTAFIQQLMDLHTGSLMLLGPTMDPKVAFELNLRLPHLGLRIAEHSRRAQTYAERMHALGVPVSYPGLADHPGHALFTRLANPGYGAGGVLGIDLGTRARADDFMELLQNRYCFGYMAVSLGYFDTLMSCSAASTSSELSDEDLRRAGISPGLVRLSVGITGTLEDRWAQLDAALGDVGLLGASGH